MPLSGWNGKFQGIGNGGFAGAIGYEALAGAVQHRDAMDPASAVERNRPLCAYPNLARYKGSGGTDDAAHFECTAK